MSSCSRPTILSRCPLASWRFNTMANIVFHPRMTALQIADFLQRHQADLVTSGRTPRIRAYARPRTPGPVTFSCQKCCWSDDVCCTVDTGTAFDPPRGEIPQCPQCGSFNVHLRIVGNQEGTR